MTYAERIWTEPSPQFAPGATLEQRTATSYLRLAVILLDLNWMWIGQREAWH